VTRTPQVVFGAGLAAGWVAVAIAWPALPWLAPAAAGLGCAAATWWLGRRSGFAAPVWAAIGAAMWALQPPWALAGAGVLGATAAIPGAAPVVLVAAITSGAGWHVWSATPWALLGVLPVAAGVAGVGRRRAVEVRTEPPPLARAALVEPAGGVERLRPEAIDARVLERERTLIERLQNVVATVRRALGAHGAYLYLRGPADRLELIVFDAVRPDLEPRPELAPGEGLIGWVFRHAEPFLAAEYAKPISGLTHLDDDHGLRSFLAVPVMQHTCMGVLAVDSLEVQAFAEEEHRQILEIMGLQAVHWLEHAEEREHLDEELERWRAFFDAANRLQRLSDHREATAYLLDLVELVTRADAAFILEKTGGGGGFQIVSSRGEATTNVSTDRVFDERESWAGWAIGVEGVRSIHDMRRRKTGLPLLYPGDTFSDRGAAICIPFQSGSEEAELVGGLVLWSAEPQRLRSDTAALMQHLIAPFQLAYARAKATMALKRMATSDALTGLANRRSAMAKLDREWRRAGRTGAAFAVILLDVDHFKGVNDTYGHDIGDLVLKYVAQTLQQSAREVDMVARFGGEEFLIILPETDPGGAQHVAERIRKTLAKRQLRLPDGRKLRVTASLGVASVRSGELPHVDALIKLADESLYVAKESGRNRVVVGDPEAEAVADAG